MGLRAESHYSADVDEIIGDDTHGQRELRWSTNRI
jgi:hypothetical protein